MKIAVNYGEFDDLPILDKSRELENYLGEEICVESLKSEPFLLTVTQDMKKEPLLMMLFPLRRFGSSR